jgi:hypothetical protein
MKYIYTVTGGPDCHNFEFVYDMFFYCLAIRGKIKRESGRKTIVYSALTFLPPVATTPVGLLNDSNNR